MKQDLLLLAPFSRSNRKTHVATCQNAVDFVNPEGTCTLRAACLPWNGWRDQALGTLGGGAEVSFETLRAIQAFDGDWVEVFYGTSCRLVRVRAVPAGKERRAGVIYLRRSLLEYLLSGGSGGGLPSACDDLAACSQVCVRVRQYIPCLNSGHVDGADKTTKCPVAVAKRVVLARVVRNNSSGSRAYTRELRAFFDCTPEPPEHCGDGTTGPTAPSASSHYAHTRIVSMGDVFGIWVPNSNTGGGAQITNLDSDSDNENVHPPDTLLPASTTTRKQGQEDVTGEDAENGALERPGHHLVYFKVVELEASAESAKGGGHSAMAVDVSRTLVIAQGPLNSDAFYILSLMHNRNTKQT